MLPPPAPLPAPDPDALAHSERLRLHLAEQIRAAGGWLDFARFMAGLLYAPGLGYYAAGAARFNAAGDFTTAPETSPLFARTLARALAPVLRVLPEAQVLEPGAGTGQLAAGLLTALAELDALPLCYRILEPSPALREEQRRLLARLPRRLGERVTWVDDLPEQFRGVVIANEVLDAMPVQSFRITQGAAVPAAERLEERGVALASDGAFMWSCRPATADLVDAVQTGLPGVLDLPPGSLFELALAARRWAHTLGRCVAEGAVILIDYGYPARELHHAQRCAGTLRCHYRHHAHDDPFFMPGLQDVTAHVDFSGIAQALRGAGLALHDFDTQAGFLLGHGVLETLAAGAVPGSVDWLRQTSALQKLVSPAEMGETFKVLVALRDPLGRCAAAFAGPGEAAVCLRLGLAAGRSGD